MTATSATTTSIVQEPGSGAAKTPAHDIQVDADKAVSRGHSSIDQARLSKAIPKSANGYGKFQLGARVIAGSRPGTIKFLGKTKVRFTTTCSSPSVFLYAFGIRYFSQAALSAPLCCTHCAPMHLSAAAPSFRCSRLHMRGLGSPRDSLQ